MAGRTLAVNDSVRIASSSLDYNDDMGPAKDSRRLTLSERFILARDSVEMNNSAFARAIGIRPPSVTDIIKGRTQSLRGGTVAAIERVTGVSGQWLVHGTGEMHRDSISAAQQDAHELAGMIADLSQDERNALRSLLDVFRQKREPPPE